MCAADAIVVMLAPKLAVKLGREAIQKHVQCLIDAGVININFVTQLKQFPAYLNRWDSQQARNEGVFAH